MLPEPLFLNIHMYGIMILEYLRGDNRGDNNFHSGDKFFHHILHSYLWYMWRCFIFISIIICE